MHGASEEIRAPGRHLIQLGSISAKFGDRRGISLGAGSLVDYRIWGESLWCRFQGERL